MRFLIDANLPYRFQVWRGSEYQHMHDLGETWPDGAVWHYAREHDLVIVTKDADFSDRVMLASPPPRVVHLRVGNMRMRKFHGFINQVWPQVLQLMPSHKLLIVHENVIECVA